MSEFYSALKFSSTCFGPHRTTRHVQQYAYYHIPNLQIQLVQNAPDDGPMMSETCRADISAD